MVHPNDEIAPDEIRERKDLALRIDVLEVDRELRRTDQVWSKKALVGEISVECVHPHHCVHEMNESTVDMGELAKDLFAKALN